MNFFTSDLHFGHKKVIEYTRRPFSGLDEMHEALVRNWNSVITPSDTVYIIGDLALCKFQDFQPWASRLLGNKKLVKGNHDHYSEGQYRKLGFEVYHEILMKIAGRMCRLSHYPYWLPWYRRPFAYKSELRYKERRPLKRPGEFLIHGHTHTQKKIINRMIHVGVDAWNYTPVPQWQIEKLFNLIENEDKN